MASRTSESPSEKPLKIRKIERAGTLSTQVSAYLENLIVENHLTEGGRLPTERELATRFDVSRTVIREAVSGLVAKGMLEVNAGSGTVIRRPSAAHVSQTMNFYLTGGQREFKSESVTEVRRLLEVEIAGLAAQRRSEGDLEELRKILADYPNVTSKMETFVKWDVSFHLTLATATHNELLVLLLNSISGIMTKVRELGFHVPGNNEGALRHHTAIFKQVELGSRDGARQAMREHIETSEKFMNVGLSLSATDAPAKNPGA